MILSRPMVMFDEWFSRIFSPGLVLAVVTGLTLAKVFTIAASLNGGLLAGWHFPSTIANSAPDSTGFAILDEEDFVPWPSALPEPAAGPEGGEELPFRDDIERKPLFDPSNLTEGESMALQQLVTRRHALDEREQMLDMRAELNGRAEVRLDEQIANLTDLKTQLEALLKGLDETEELKFARLVKIYETMKPKAAAEIFNRLEIPVLLHVIERMKEVKSAAILGKMNPVIAKHITTELAKKNERPTLTDSTDG